MKPSINSLHYKISFLACSMTLFASLMVGGFSHYHTIQITKRTAMEGLAKKTHLVAAKFKDPYEQMKNDVFIVAHTPPIKGIMRTQDNKPDTVDGSTRTMWLKRLQTIFHSIMTSRLHYTQMRYIGVKNNGKELVRVNRIGQKLQAVTQDKLQYKAQETYFKKSLQLKEGQTLFSRVTYNRERGKVEASLIPTIRIMTPVYEDDTLFGFIVINADYRELLMQTFRQIRPRCDIFLANQDGDYLKYDHTIGQVDFQYHEEYKTFPLQLQKIISSKSTEHAFIENRKVSYVVKLDLNMHTSGHFIGVIAQIPENELLESVHETRNNSLLLIIIISVICIMIAGIVAQTFTRPLKQMTTEILNVEAKQNKNPHLPITRKDEIGELARAFRRMTHTLQKSEAKSRAVLDNISDAIITFDENGMIDDSNPASENIFGYSSQQIQEQNITMLLCEKFLDKYNLDYLKSQHIIQHEVEGKRQDGCLFPMELSVNQIHSKEPQLFTAIMRDITERKQIDIMKDEFVSTVNHELRTPLTSIQGGLGLLRFKGAKMLDKQCQRLLEICYNNCGRLSHLVNDMLDMEKITAGKMEYAIETVDICILTREIIERHQNYADRYHVHFVIEQKIEKAFCDVDSSRYNQALVNLISNAAKFSPKGDTVTITIDIHNDQVRIAVKDNGPGIPNNFRNRIFQKFAQAKTTVHTTKGSGLGLYITRSIIEAFSGNVSFESEEGKGSTFYFTLPKKHKGKHL